MGLKSFLSFSQERIPVILRRIEVLFDRSGRSPTDEIEKAAGLVVGAGSAGASKGLLTDHGSGRLVVDVEISRGIDEHLRRRFDRAAVRREDRARQSIGGGLIAEPERLLVPVLGIDVDREHRAEDLLAQRARGRVLGFDNRRLYEVALGVVAFAAE